MAQKRKNRPKIAQNPFLGDFGAIFGHFFPIFPVKPKSIFGPFFLISDLGRNRPKSENRLPGRQTCNECWP